MQTNPFKALGLPESQAQILLEGFYGSQETRFRKIFRERKICTEVGIITKGKCRFFYNTKDGEVTRWIALTNDFVASLSSFITQQPGPENIQFRKVYRRFFNLGIFLWSNRRKTSES